MLTDKQTVLSPMESDLRAENESVSDIRLMRAGQESDLRAENEKFNM